MSNWILSVKAQINTVGSIQKLRMETCQVKHKKYLLHCWGFHMEKGEQTTNLF